MQPVAIDENSLGAFACYRLIVENIFHVRTLLRVVELVVTGRAEWREKRKDEGNENGAVRLRRFFKSAKRSAYTPHNVKADSCYRVLRPEAASTSNESSNKLLEGKIAEAFSVGERHGQWLRRYVVVKVFPYTVESERLVDLRKVGNRAS